MRDLSGVIEMLYIMIRVVVLSARVCVKSLQSCPTLCDPMDCSPPGSSVHGTSEARRLEWIAISFSRGSSQPRDSTHISCIFCMVRQESLSHQGSPNALIFAFKTGIGNMKINSKIYSNSLKY